MAITKLFSPARSVEASSKALMLRAQFEREPLLKVAGAHDALSAMCVESSGHYHAVWAGGLGIATSRGMPDASVLPREEFLDAARRMSEAVSIPVIADCDTGFGDAAETVRQYEHAGIAAVCIEDKVFPKRNSFATGPQTLAPVDAFVRILEAAKGAQRTREFMVFARTEALIAGLGQREARRRADAYAAAGADAIVVHSKAETAREIAEFAESWDHRLPLVVIPTTYPAVTVADLSLLGVKVVIYANQAIRAAIRAMDEVLATIGNEGSTLRVEADILPLQTLVHLMDARSPEQERSAA